MALDTSGDDRDGRRTIGTLKVGASYFGVPVETLAEVCQISELLPVLVSARGLLGGLNLRGAIIPVIDPSVISGQSPLPKAPKFAAVLRHNDRRLAVGIDGIDALLHVNESELSQIDGLPAETAALVGGVLLEKDMVVTVANVSALFDEPGIPSISVARLKERQMASASWQPMLTFVAGGTRYSMPAVETYGTVPRQTIEVNSLTSGPCLGSITYHNRRIPVLHTVSVLGVGHDSAVKEAEVVILRCRDDQLLGFAVDMVKEIRAVDPAGTMPVPRTLSIYNSLLRSVRLDEDGQQVFEVDVEKLRETEDLMAIAALSKDEEMAEEVEDRALDGDANLVHEKRRYLVYGAGRMCATPLRQVARIITPPEVKVTLGTPDGGIIGYFAYQGHSVPLVDLGLFFGQSPIEKGADRVLLVGQSGEEVGFLVGKVDSIAVSDWRHIVPDGQPCVEEGLVQVRLGEQTTVLPFVDLQEIVLRIGGHIAPENLYS